MVRCTLARLLAILTGLLILLLAALFAGRQNWRALREVACVVGPQQIAPSAEPSPRPALGS